MAKLVIRLINNVAKVINADPDVEGLLTVLFVPDYSVSLGKASLLTHALRAASLIIMPKPNS